MKGVRGCGPVSDFGVSSPPLPVHWTQYSVVSPPCELCIFPERVLLVQGPLLMPQVVADACRWIVLYLKCFPLRLAKADV